jgi:hypothetical protein
VTAQPPDPDPLDIPGADPGGVQPGETPPDSGSATPSALPPDPVAGRNLTPRSVAGVSILVVFCVIAVVFVVLLLVSFSGHFGG